ncbi:SHOCT domain-containing protein [Ensifer sp. SL37]|uniref:SHOCT domain-containing protein n=1 Tax=Ensifer sp. SL37 TaxID=2995137 RepID=UPI002272E254|nr:SHOCT domain-containing protein [Ensifer sp. SL37]MCY1744648.1 SHOCT domain-containing protein [Ensifer sp. SL37]
MLAVGKQRSITRVAGIVLLGTLAGCNSQGTNFENYPSVYGQKPAATTQMTNDEAASMQARLSSLGAARKSGAISEAEYQRRLKEMRALAEQHGADTLKEIQN